MASTFKIVTPKRVDSGPGAGSGLGFGSGLVSSGFGTTMLSILPSTRAFVPVAVYTTCIPSALVYTKYKTCPLALQVIHCTVPLTPASAAIVVVAVLPAGGLFTCSRYCPLPSVKATLPPVTSGAFASNGPAQLVKAAAFSAFPATDAFCTKA